MLSWVGDGEYLQSLQLLQILEGSPLDGADPVLHELTEMQNRTDF